MDILVPFFVLTSLLLSGHHINGDLVQATCKGTPNYGLCVTILQKDPRSSKADVAGLGLIMVDSLKAKTLQTDLQIAALKRLRKPRLAKALKECAEDYGIVLKYSIPEAVEGLTKGNPKFAEDGVVDAAEVARECETNFKPSISPLTASNKAVEDLAGVARAIIRKLL